MQAYISILETWIDQLHTINATPHIARPRVETNDYALSTGDRIYQTSIYWIFHCIFSPSMHNEDDEME